MQGQLLLLLGLGLINRFKVEEKNCKSVPECPVQH